MPLFRKDFLDPQERPARPCTLLAGGVSSVPALFLARAERDAHRIAFRSKHHGRWRPTSWLEFADASKRLATWLVQQGVAKGDKVCIVGSTRAEWCVADMGGQLAAAVTLGAYPTLTDDQLGYILDHADAVVAIVEGQADLDKVLSQREKLPKLRKILVWSGEGADGDLVVAWDDALATEVDDAALHERTQSIDVDDTAIIVYTSGTTGPPKGAMIAHRSILAVLDGQKENIPFSEDDVSFNFLPMAHVAERVLGFYGRINNGVTCYFASAIDKVLEEVQEVKPTMFGSVPRIFEKAYAKMLGQVEQAPPARQRVFRWAEATGRKCVQRWQQGETTPPHLQMQYRLADRLVFSKIREVFGGRVRFFVTGAAPIAPEILEFFWAAGFRIYEVYGQTEATVVTHANRPGSVRLGSVGQALPYVEHRIAEDGEILIRGGAVFQGYYKNPEATVETIQNGWLHTGDIGEIDDEGYLYIRDRKKHIIITAGGKNLTPANIENELKASDPIISQAHVHGDRRKYLTALVTIGPGEAIELARQKQLASDAEADRMLADLQRDPLAVPEGLPELMSKLTADTGVRERVVNAIRKANSKLAKVETIKRVFLLDRELSVDEDELTPTLKVKRKNVEAKFAAEFDRLYDDESFGLKIM